MAEQIPTFDNICPQCGQKRGSVHVCTPQQSTDLDEAIEQIAKALFLDNHGIYTEDDWAALSQMRKSIYKNEAQVALAATKATGYMTCNEFVKMIKETKVEWSEQESWVGTVMDGVGAYKRALLDRVEKKREAQKGES